MLPLRRFSHPCGQPFYNCPYVTPAHLEPVWIDSCCESQRTVPKAGKLITTQTGRKTLESLLLVCKVQMVGHLCRGKQTLWSGCLLCWGGPVCQGWSAVGSSTDSPEGSDRLHLRPAALPAPGSAFKPRPGPGSVVVVSWLCHGCVMAVSLLCLSCVSCLSAAAVLLRALCCQAHLGRVSSPASGPSCRRAVAVPRARSRACSSPRLCCPSWPGPGRLGAACASEPWPPSSSGHPLGHARGARALRNHCSKSPRPLPDREWGKSPFPFQSSKKEIKLEVPSNLYHSMILPSTYSLISSTRRSENSPLAFC